MHGRVPQKPAEDRTVSAPSRPFLLVDRDVAKRLQSMQKFATRPGLRLESVGLLFAARGDPRVDGRRSWRAGRSVHHPRYSAASLRDVCLQVENAPRRAAAAAASASDFKSKFIGLPQTLHGRSKRPYPAL